MGAGLEEIRIHRGQPRIRRKGELLHPKVALVRGSLIAVHLRIPVDAAAKDGHDGEVGKCKGGAEVR